MAIVRVALAQPLQCDTSNSRVNPPTPATDNLKRIVRCIETAKEKPTDIICFPETALSGDSRDVPPDCHGEIADAVRQAGIWCIYGSYVRDGKMVYNEAIVVKPDGSVAAKIRKAHLWHEEGVTAGTDIPQVIETPFGKIGVIICWDIAFPDRARFLAVKGADIVFCPAFWYGDKFGTTEILPSIVQTRAFENQIFMVLVDAPNHKTTGFALIAGPDGKFTFRERSRSEQGFNWAYIDTNLLAASRAKFDCGPQRW